MDNSADGERATGSHLSISERVAAFLLPIGPGRSPSKHPLWSWGPRSLLLVVMLAVGLPAAAGNPCSDLVGVERLWAGLVGAFFLGVLVSAFVGCRRLRAKEKRDEEC